MRSGAARRPSMGFQSRGRSPNTSTIHRAHAAKTLFATHYHELTELAERLPGAQNYQIRVAERDGEVIFLYRLERGRASKSYGIEVARIAGLPPSVLARARDVLARLERYELDVFAEENGHPATSEGARFRLQLNPTRLPLPTRSNRLRRTGRTPSNAPRAVPDAARWRHRRRSSTPSTTACLTTFAALMSRASRRRRPVNF